MDLLEIQEWSLTIKCNLVSYSGHPLFGRGITPCTLLYTQYYKVRIKSKVEQSRERSSAPLRFGVVAIEKGIFELPSTMVAYFLLLLIVNIYLPPAFRSKMDCSWLWIILVLRTTHLCWTKLIVFVLIRSVRLVGQDRLTWVPGEAQHSWRAGKTDTLWASGDRRLASYLLQ